MATLIPIALALALAFPAAAEPFPPRAVCRADRLGSVACPAPRPVPRPPFDAEISGIERARERAGPEAKRPTVIPPWRTNSFGDTLPAPGRPGAAARCRADALGNLHCF